MDAVKTGRFISELRSERGLTQQQLAERLYVTFKAVSRWETGRGMPDVENLEALSRELGVSIIELLNGERLERAISADAIDEIARDGISQAERLFRKKAERNLVCGVLAVLAVALMVFIHITSPSTIPYHEGLIEIKRTEDGILLASFEDDVCGCSINYETDSETGETIAFISCYSKLWSSITGTTDLGWRAPGMHSTVAIGSDDTVSLVFYYPAESLFPNDSSASITVGSMSPLLYARDGTDSFYAITQPRRGHDRLIIVAAITGIVCLAVFAVLRKRSYAYLILSVSILSLSFALSSVAVLWGRFDRIFDASFYFSGIALLTLVFYYFTLFVILRIGRGRSDRITGVVHRYAAVHVAAVSLLATAVFATCTLYAHSNDGFRSRTILIPPVEYVLQNGYPINSSGQTYGPGGLTDANGMCIEEPDLLLVQGNDGVVGYASLDDLVSDYVPSNPEEAVMFTESQPSERRIPLYDRDGKTVVGTFRAGG